MGHLFKRRYDYILLLIDQLLSQSGIQDTLQRVEDVVLNYFILIIPVTVGKLTSKCYYNPILSLTKDSTVNIR